MALAYIEYFISRLEEIYRWIIIGYILLSWFPNAKESFIGKWLAKVSEPYLRIFRRIIPSIGPIDISPVIALIALHYAVIGIIVVIEFVYFRLAR